MTRALRILLCLMLLTVLPGAAHAGETTEVTADEIVAAVNARDEGVQMQRTVTLNLIDRHGNRRTQELRHLRSNTSGERRIALFYRAPANVRDTALLIYDYADARDDDQWLYLPALRRVRRIAATDRGDYFLNTDFTYDDIKNEGRLKRADYTFSRAGDDTIDGHRVLVLEGVPVPASREALGYGRVRWYVDPTIWRSRRIEMWDVNDNRLKTIEYRDFSAIDGIWTTNHTRVTNHKSDHVTELVASDVDYRTDIPDRLLTPNALMRGLR